MTTFHRILFVELLGGLGDLLMALPAVHALARSHPAARLSLLTFAPGSELLHQDPWVDRVIEAVPGAGRSSLDELLSQEAFDLIVSDTSYEGIATAIQASGAARVVTNLWRSPPPHQRVGDRFLQILLAEGLITAEAIAQNQPLLQLRATEQKTARQALGAADRPLIVLCPDAGMSIKRWPEANFVALGQALHQQYAATLLVPVGSDPRQAQQIADAIGSAARVWPRGTLRELAAVLAIADLVVAADTGPARIAAALDRPTITLFGPSWHGRYGQPAPHVNLQGFPDCPERKIHNFTEQPCWYSGHCPFEWSTCLEDISVSQVLQAAAPFLTPPLPEAQPPAPFPPAPARIEPYTPWRSICNLLVLRLDNIGDVIMTSPVLRTLRANLPEAQITLMASPGGALAAPLLPWVDEVLPQRVVWQDLGRLDFSPDREWQLIESLRARQFDAAIILTSFSQSPHPAALVCALAGIPLRLGESKETDIGTLTHAVAPAPDDLHQVDRNLRLIEAVGFPVADRRLALQIPLATPFSMPYLLLTPWTSCQARNYSADRFAIAARRLSEITGWPVVVTGVDKDRDRAAPLLAQLGNCALDLIGQTSLSELAALVAGARLVLTNNTSTMHIADATGTPNLVLFAGTELECQWQPRHSPSRLLRRPTVCSPCYGFVCPYQLECLDIPPEAVVAAGLELLSLTKEAARFDLRYSANGERVPLA